MPELPRLPHDTRPKIQGSCQRGSRRIFSLLDCQLGFSFCSNINLLKGCSFSSGISLLEGCSFCLPINLLGECSFCSSISSLGGYSFGSSSVFLMVFLFAFVSICWKGALFVFYQFSEIMFFYSPGSAVAQSVKRAAPGQDVVSPIPAPGAPCPLAGSVPLSCNRLRQKSWSARPVTLWLHIRLKDFNLGTRPRDSLVADEDFMKPTKQSKLTYQFVGRMIHLLIY